MRSRFSPRDATRYASSSFGGSLGATTMMPGSGKLVARAAAPFDRSGRPDASAPTPSLTVTVWRTRFGPSILQKTIAEPTDGVTLRGRVAAHFSAAHAGIRAEDRACR
jgi:hypothetical protein